MSLKSKKIGLIGGGNMAEALLKGLIDSRRSRPSRISVSEPRPNRRRSLQKQFKISVSSDNRKLLDRNDVIVLAVKPQTIPKVLDEIRPHVTKRHLIISIAAGVDTKRMEHLLGRKTRLIRAMPNTPALIRRGITGLYARRGTYQSDLKLAEELFSSVGETVIFSKESDLDWVTAVSGSGPAYVFFFLESLIDAALKGGISKEKAHKLALATTEGAAALARSQKMDLRILRERVTSKGGTTDAALKVLKTKKWSQALISAVRAAAARACQLRSG